jgi:hypothetical protein
MSNREIAEAAREMADLLRRFVSGDVKPYEWDDFMGIKFENPFLEQMRIRANVIADALPPRENENTDEGAAALLEIASELELAD